MIIQYCVINDSLSKSFMCLMKTKESRKFSLKFFVRRSMTFKKVVQLNLLKVFCDKKEQSWVKKAFAGMLYAVY